MLLVTGSSGLIGRHLCARLASLGRRVRPFDLQRDVRDDVRDRVALAAALDGVEGVVHLAAVSRVIWGERNPVLCQAVNVDAVSELVDLCSKANPRPWLVFASSREVYGDAASLPVHESAPLHPVNTYGLSKQEGERIVQSGRDRGVLANVCRLSNVFGCPLDHHDRVAMAFAGAAARGGIISVEGSANTFDFTVVSDVVDGLVRLIESTSVGRSLPPVHFVSGRGTSLRELATIAAGLALKPMRIVEAPPRRFDVATFIGDPSRALELLGWRATTNVCDALGKLVIELAAREVADANGRRRAEPRTSPARFQR